jgi:hypothetical protein
MCYRWILSSESASGSRIIIPESIEIVITKFKAEIALLARYGGGFVFSTMRVRTFPDVTK